jgi:hypothetical protein
LGTSANGGRLKRTLGSVGLGLLVLTGAYYAWSADVASASRLHSGNAIEIRTTIGAVHIAGTPDHDVRVTIENVSEELASTARVTIDRSRNPILIEIRDLPQRAVASVEVPRNSSLAVSMLAGELLIRDVDGDKRCLLRSGKLSIAVGDPESYRSARAFVFAGAIQAPAFNRDKGGLLRMMWWKGPGRAVIDAHVSAGLVELR